MTIDSGRWRGITEPGRALVVPELGRTRGTVGER